MACFELYDQRVWLEGDFVTMVYWL